MRIKPLDPIVLAENDPTRAPGVHASDIYGSLYQRLEPKRYAKDEPMDWNRIALGLAWEQYLERRLEQLGLNIARPGEFHSSHGFNYTPDLFIHNGAFRVGEIKLTWMSAQGWPRDPKFDKWMTQVKLYCVAPFVRLLTRDLRWVKASQLAVGDMLLGFDEHGSAANHKRCWKPTEILKITRTLKPAYSLVFDDGTEVVCSADHQWLVHPSPTANARWMRTDCLLREDSDSYTGNKKYDARVSKPLDVWDVDSTYEGGYFSRILDGEGYLTQHASHNGNSLFAGIVQCEGIVADNIRYLLRRAHFDLRERIQRPTITQPRPTLLFSVGTFREVLRLLGTFRPARLLQKWDSFNRWTAMTNTRTVGIRSRKFIGKTEVLAIETTSHTFVAEGLASHNCHEVQTPYATLYPYFVNGGSRGYKKGGPEFLPVDMEFSARELRDNFQTLMSHARSEGML